MKHLSFDEKYRYCKVRSIAVHRVGEPEWCCKYHNLCVPATCHAERMKICVDRGIKME